MIIIYGAPLQLLLLIFPSHHIYSLALDGNLHLAPIESPNRILDLGTGTGLWVLEMAERFPKATVIGNDLSPIQPTWYISSILFFCLTRV